MNESARGTVVQTGQLERDYDTRMTPGKELWYKEDILKELWHKKDILKGIMVQGGHLERNYGTRRTS